MRANVPEEATLPSVRAIGIPIAESVVAMLRSHVATMPQPAPVAKPFDLRDGRLRHPFQPSEDEADLLLVVDRIASALRKL